MVNSSRVSAQDNSHALLRTFLALALPLPPLAPSASDRSDSEASSSPLLSFRARWRRCEGPVGEGRFLLPVLAVAACVGFGRMYMGWGQA